MPIPQLVDAILDRRLGRNGFAGRGRLQAVETRIRALQEVQGRVDVLHRLIGVISSQVKEKKGQYYQMLAADPEALANFDGISALEAKDSLRTALDQLEELKERFSRQALRVAFIGYERQGKSTFIKAMTDLPDTVIPAFSGPSCTGAVSVIHNHQGPFRAEITFYTPEEFLDNLRRELHKHFPDREFRLSSVSDIAKLDLSDYDGPNKLQVTGELMGKTVRHAHEYGQYLGRGAVTFTDPEDVASFVSQYREYDAVPAGASPAEFTSGPKYDPVTHQPKTVYYRHFYNYLAVKSVHIYCQFANPDCGQLEFVDTVGLGAPFNSQEIEKEMFRVLRRDCDGAVSIFRPAGGGGTLKDEQQTLCRKINLQMADRDPRRWMAYAVNRCQSGPDINIQNIQATLDQLTMMGDNLPFGFFRDIDGSDRREVNDNLLVPLLELITRNLDSLDQELMDTTETSVREAYDQSLQLVKAANAVTAASLGHTSDVMALFDDCLYHDLMKNLGRALNQVDNKGYRLRRDARCDELSLAYQDIIDHLSRFRPKEKAIRETFETGANLSEERVFEDYAEQMRNDIFAAFEQVNLQVLRPLQEKVKTDLEDVLYKDGMMSRLPVSTSGPSNAWLQAVIDNYIPQKEYPALHEALVYLLDYQINIEGSVEYEVARSLYIIDSTHREYIRYQGQHTDDFAQKASNVWQELANRCVMLKERLRKWIDDFSLIPSNSFYTRVQKFHIKLLTDEGGLRDLRRFYRNNMGLIWGQEIAAVTKTQKAFGQWNDAVQSLQQIVTPQTFGI